MSRPEADSYRTCTIVHESNKGETNKPEKMRAPLFENTYTECKILGGLGVCLCRDGDAAAPRVAEERRKELVVCYGP